jgi:hypothetical protein
MASQTSHLRVLLRNLETGLLFKSGSEWITSAEEARDFKSVPEAIEFAAKEKLRGMEAFLISGEAKGGIRLPDPD